MINKELLTYNCKLVTFDYVDDGYGTKTNEITTDIKNVYFTTIDSYTDTEVSYNPTSSISRLFYDMKLSNPSNINFDYNDIIIYNNSKYKIINIHKTHLQSHIELDLQLIE